MFLEDVVFFFYPPAHVGPIVPVFSVAKLTPRHWSCHEVSEKSWQLDSAIPKLPSIFPQQNKKERRQRVKVVLSADVDFWTMKWILHWICFFFPLLSPPATQYLAHSSCFHRIGLQRQVRSYIFVKGYHAENWAKILSCTVWSRFYEHEAQSRDSARFGIDSAPRKYSCNATDNNTLLDYGVYVIKLLNLNELIVIIIFHYIIIPIIEKINKNLLN